MSVDVAGLAALMDTRRRFPTKRIAIFPCAVLYAAGVEPRHDPTPDNVSHAIVPGTLSQGNARKVKESVISVIGALDTADEDIAD